MCYIYKYCFVSTLSGQLLSVCRSMDYTQLTKDIRSINDTFIKVQEGENMETNTGVTQRKILR